MTIDLGRAARTAWRPGDPVGGRRFASLGPLRLESGSVLPDVRLAYETWGDPDCGRHVLVLHALTGDSHVSGPAGEGHPSPGWWDGLVGPGKVLDTDRFHVVAANVLGGCQGSTGPASAAPDGAPWGSRFPELSVRDQVAAERGLAQSLGIDRWHAVVGGSAGGMRALEWAVTVPEAVERLFLVATGAAASAEQIALTGIQAAAIRADPAFHGGDYYDDPVGPVAGLDLARRIAHLAYRSEDELRRRFGRRTDATGQWEVDSYLRHHGSKLVGRFDPNSYLVLGRSMGRHDVGRGRGGTATALGLVTAATRVVAIDSDRLYPRYLQEELVDGIPGSAPLDVVTSLHGHDGFLVEVQQVGEVLADLLAS